ncbi:MAG: DUF4253 domain-containing protein [Burkholderiaceae bacterium]|jgi:hypothetical protein|nr:DUF4253 domain-containing protein [Burkholderiaceae bacterium]
MTYPYPYEIVTGAAALKRLHELRASKEGIPIILGGKEKFERVQECYSFIDSTPEELVAKAATLDPMAWLKEREEEDSEYFKIKESDWPEETFPNDALSAHLDIRSREPLDEVYITILPASDTWKAACYLKIGGWNSMPNAHEHSALWRYWEERYGAKVACIADDVIEFTVEHPPQTRAEAMELARQQYIYCADIVHQGVESVEALAAIILKAPVWYFWWD